MCSQRPVIVSPADKVERDMLGQRLFTRPGVDGEEYRRASF
jgi:hypothetical protein